MFLYIPNRCRYTSTGGGKYVGLQNILFNNFNFRKIVSR